MGMFLAKCSVFSSSFCEIMVAKIGKMEECYDKSSTPFEYLYIHSKEF